MRAIGGLVRLIRERAYRHRPEGFRLSSGAVSEHYIDAKAVFSCREGLDLFARFAHAVFVGMDVAAVGGLEIGAIAPAAAIVLSSPENQPLRLFTVRKAPKDHGTAAKVEGDLRPGDRVAVIEDVLTTGRSALQAIRAVEALSCQVVVVLALVNRQEGTLPELSSYPIWSVCTLAELLT